MLRYEQMWHLKLVGLKSANLQCTLKLDRREGGPELIIMFSDYDTTASKLSCDEIPLVQSFQPIGNELTFCVL